MLLVEAKIGSMLEGISDVTERNAAARPNVVGPIRHCPGRLAELYARQGNSGGAVPSADSAIAVNELL